MTTVDITEAWPMVSLHGVALHRMTESQCIKHVMDALDEARGGWVVTANLDHVRRLVHEPGYSELCKKASLVVADGMPLIWASKLQGTPLPERVAGSNLIWSLSEAAGQAGKSIFLLGGTPGTAERAGQILSEKFANLRIAGSYFPAFGFEHNPLELKKITQLLQEAKPDIIYVALGSPKQEQLAAQMREILPSAWWLGVGISFSFICGEVHRAPNWMQNTGLEWVHRLIQEPRRLSKRYLVHDIPFALSLFGVAAGKRLRKKPQNGSLNGH